MGNPAWRRLGAILLIVVVLFGASKLPQLGKGLGEGIRSFKKSFSGDEEEKPGATGSSSTPQSGEQKSKP